MSARVTYKTELYSITTLNIRTSAGGGFEAASWKYDTRPHLPTPQTLMCTDESQMVLLIGLNWFNSEKKKTVNWTTSVSTWQPFICLFVYLFPIHIHLFY